LELIEICCKNCKITFFVCRSCRNKGQTYCSKACRRAYRRLAHRKAQSKYRKSKKGNKKNKIYEKHRRKGLRKKKRVADRATTLGSFRCKILPSYNYQPDAVSDADTDTDADADVNLYKQDFSAQTEKSRKDRCRFCGSAGTIVDKFSRRGYKSCKSSRASGSEIRPPVLRC